MGILLRPWMMTNIIIIIINIGFYQVEFICCSSDIKTRLDSLVDDDAHGLVHFKDPSFTEDVIFGASRSYHLFILATTLDVRYKCDVCQEIQSEYQLLGQSYQRSRLNENHDVLWRSPQDDLPVYFTVADYQWNSALFKKLDITSAPHVIYVAPKDASESESKSLESQNVYSRFQSGQSHGQAQVLLESFIRPRSGLSFRIVQPLWNTIGLMIQLGVLALAFIYLLVRHGLWIYQTFAQNKNLWMSISTLCYMLSVSGMVYCVIRNPPLLAQGPQGQAVYISPDGRSQYVLEGLFIGILNVFMAMSLVAVCQWTIYLPPSVLKTSVTTALVFVFYFTWSMIRSLYTFKNAWYAGF